MKWIATFGGVGYLRPAPGTWGSLVAIPFAWGLHGLWGPMGLALATLGLFAVGLYALNHLRDAGDASEFVVDEVVGQWIALLPLSVGLAYMGAGPWVFPWPGWGAAFLLFRFFDIYKPWLVGRFDKRHDALGIMMDDVMAGLFAALCLMLLAGAAHGVMGW